MKILFIINDGFEEAETICPYDILVRAGVDVVVSSNKTSAQGSHNLTLSNLTLLNTINFTEFDLVVLPGGPEWKNNSNDKLYLEAIDYFIKNKAIASICATPTILGRLGYLKGKTYTCFPLMNEDFGGHFTGSDAEIDHNIITGRGAGSSLEFGYKIVEYLLGKEKSEEVKNDMFYTK